MSSNECVISIIVQLNGPFHEKNTKKDTNLQLAPNINPFF